MHLPGDRFTVKERRAYFRQFLDIDGKLADSYNRASHAFLRHTDEWGIPDGKCTEDTFGMLKKYDIWGKGYVVRDGKKLAIYCAHNASRLTPEHHEVLQYLGITLLEKRSEWIMYVQEDRVSVFVFRDEITLAEPGQGLLIITKDLPPLEILRKLRKHCDPLDRYYFSVEAFQKWCFRHLRAESELMIETLQSIKDIDHTLIAIVLLNIYDETEKLRRRRGI